MKMFGIRIHGENKYLHLLVWLLVNFLASPFIEKINPRFPLLSLVFLLSLLLTLRTLDLKRSTFAVCASMGVLAFMFEVIPGTILSVLSLCIFIVFIALSIFLMLRQMFSTTKVTGDTVIGGVCVYFLLGYLFALFYYLIYIFDHNAFVVASQWDGLYLFYLSFTTLTTLGYGDVYPVNTIAMVIANLEAITGQMFLAIFVARMVGLHIIHHASRTHGT